MARASATSIDGSDPPQETATDFLSPGGRFVWVCSAHALQGVVGIRPAGVGREPVHLFADWIDSTT